MLDVQKGGQATTHYCPTGWMAGVVVNVFCRELVVGKERKETILSWIKLKKTETKKSYFYGAIWRWSELFARDK